MKEKWEKVKAWSKANPVMACMIAAAVLLVLLQILRVAGQYQDLVRTAEAISAARAA